MRANGGQQSVGSAAEASGPQQLALPGAAEMFAAVGLETLPLGVGNLTAKQLRFAVAYLECGSAREAARRTGYAEQHAAKVMQTGSVSRFINQASAVVAQNGDQLVRRVWERSVSLHHELMELRAIPFAEKSDKQLRREERLLHMVNRDDTLLGALLNRLGIKLTGEVAVNHSAANGGDFVVIPADALAGFAAMRQEVIAAGRLSAGGAN